MDSRADHQNVSSPADSRPTALDIIKDEKLDGMLKGKTVLVTGAASGLGLETARALYATGARIFITGRDIAKGEQVAKSLSAPGQVPVEFIPMELDSFDSIKACAVEFSKRSEGLNILICNAGVMAPPLGRTKEGFEEQFGVNYMGHFLLFQCLQDSLLMSSTPGFTSRVVTLSSCGHRSSPVRFDDYNFDRDPYDRWVAYGQSKTADIYLANEIEYRFGDRGLHGLSVHPGFIHTPLERHALKTPAADAVINNPEAAHVWKSPEQGAATTVWAAVGKQWESKGAAYLEDMGLGEPFQEDRAWHPVFAAGHAPYAFDKIASKRLWDESLELVAEKGTRKH